MPAGTQAFSAIVDGDHDAISAVTSDMRVLRWRVSDGVLQDRLDIAPPKGGGFESASFEMNGSYVLAAANGTVHLWNLVARRQEASWRASAKPLFFQQMATGADRVVTFALADSELRVWNLESNALARAFAGPFMMGQLDHKAERLLGVGGGVAEIWNTQSGKNLVHYPINRMLYIGIFSPDERYALFGGTETAAQVWRTDAPVPVARLEGHSTAIGFGAFLDDEIAVTGTVDGMLWIWQWRTETLLSKLSFHRANTNWGVAKTPYLATTDTEGMIGAWKLPTFAGDAATLAQAAEEHGAFVLRNGRLATRKPGLAR